VSSFRIPEWAVSVQLLGDVVMFGPRTLRLESTLQLCMVFELPSYFEGKRRL
jgi:hypothetical protein